MILNCKSEFIKGVNSLKKSELIKYQNSSRKQLTKVIINRKEFALKMKINNHNLFSSQ